jgi:hypothetical protein
MRDTQEGLHSRHARAGHVLRHDGSTHVRHARKRDDKALPRDATAVRCGAVDQATHGGVVVASKNRSIMSLVSFSDTSNFNSSFNADSMSAASQRRYQNFLENGSKKVCQATGKLVFGPTNRNVSRGMVSRITPPQ